MLSFSAVWRVFLLTLGLVVIVGVSFLGVGGAQELGTGVVDSASVSRCISEPQNDCLYTLFEDVVYEYGKSTTPDEAVVSLCGPISDLQMQSACYFNMGHVLMRYSEYDTARALSFCDASGEEYQSYCWEGVFMENNNKFFELFQSEGTGFSDENPLAPCTEVNREYREICYKNHGRYLRFFFDGAPFPATDICSDTEGYADVCVRAIESVSFDAALDDRVVEQEGIEAEPRSWFQKMLDFFFSLFDSRE